MKINNRWLFLFLTPYCVGALCFILFPILYSLYVSFTNWSIYGPGNWIGLKNIFRLFGDKVFILSLKNTAYYVVLVVPLEIGLSIVIACLLNQNKLKGVNFFKAAYLMPFVLSLISVGLVWSWLYSPKYGFISQAFELFGYNSPPWLTDPSWAMPSIVYTTVWRNAGYYIIIFLGGLQSIPVELYESVKIDGAGPIKTFFSITFPLLSSTIFTSLVMATIWAWQVFDLTYIMTKGGPARATLSTGLHIYNTAFTNAELGVASAQGWLLLIIILVFTGLFFLFQNKWVYYEN